MRSTLRRGITSVIASVVAVVSLCHTATHAQPTPLATAFTYQGELASAGSPATGSHDVRFRLYNASSGGNQVGSTLCSDNLAVSNGRFAASLDFGSVFSGQKWFLEIEVRPDTGLDCSDASGYTVLSPRQELTATPNATFAQNADTANTATTATNATSLNGQLPSFYQTAANLTGTLADTRLTSNVARLNSDQTFTGLLNFANAGNTFAGNGAGLTNLSGGSISAGSVPLSGLERSTRGVLSNLTSLLPPALPFYPVAWGSNSSGQSAVPSLPPGFTYTTVAGGGFHSLALRSDGGIDAWGLNFQGSTVVPFLPGGVRYTAVAAGEVFSLALRSDGTVVTWGDSASGQLNIPTLPAGVTYTAVAAGGRHCLAVRSNGTVAAWGRNVEGQTNVPVLPIGLLYTGVAGGYAHSLALRSNGSAVGWGDNTYGQRTVPALPAGLRYTAVAAGEFHSLGLRSDGTVAAWGRSSEGQLDVPALPAGVTYTAVAAGSVHSLALRSDGLVLAWGQNGAGQLDVPNLPDNVRYTAIAGGYLHCVAVRSELAVGGISVAGGSSFGGNLGIGTSPTAFPLAFANAVGSKISLFSANGTEHYGFGIQNGTLQIMSEASTNITALGWGSSTNFNELMRVTGSGVGIRTGVTPTTGLEVAGGMMTSSGTALHAQGAFLEWNKNNGDGSTWLLNQKGGGPGGIRFGEVSSGNIVTERMRIEPNGNVTVIGSLAKAGGSFKIDHPLDPENKYLYHSFVESPDMMNIYNGIVTTDSRGFAVVELPDYFEALNRDFRYQLTVVDGSENDFILAKIYREIGIDAPRQFTIKSSVPNIKVSWQVTGIRQDAWAQKNRIPNSVDKPAAEKGKLLHPEAFDKSPRSENAEPSQPVAELNSPAPAGTQK